MTKVSFKITQVDLSSVLRKFASGTAHELNPKYRKLTERRRGPKRGSKQ